MSGKGINNHFPSTFYTFPILPFKVEKNEAENSSMSQSLEIFDYHASLW